MKVLVYSAKDFEIPFLEKANQHKHELVFVPERLTGETAMTALNHDAVAIFSADDASGNVLEKLKTFGVKHIALRSAGYDNVNIKKAKHLGLTVANAPDYSPNAIAEHAIALLLALNRKIHLAHKQVALYNFGLSSLVGFDLKDKKIGVVGTGRIGSILVKILHGFDCDLYGYDIQPDTQLEQTFQLDYTTLETLFKQCDVVFLSVPLNSKTFHLVDRTLLSLMPASAILVNVARGAVVDTAALLDALAPVDGAAAQKHIAGYATDVYEKESGVFFYDRSNNPPDDDLLAQLLTHPRVLLTPHQAFATKEALANIAQMTIASLDAWEIGQTSAYNLLS